MAFTLSTVPLTLFAIILCMLSKGRLLPVMMFMSIFQAASVLDLSGGSIGVGISYVLLLAAVAKSWLHRRSNPSLAQIRGDRTTTSLLILLLLYATFSAFLFPFLFQGALVTNPKLGAGFPLKWETGHLNQLFYLSICVGLFLTASYRSSAAELKQSVNWYIFGNVLASCVAIYQFICLHSSLPFPTEYLDTNQSYATFGAYQMGEFTRTNATFIEASAAAGSITPALALVAWRLLTQPNLTSVLIASVLFIGLFLTVSSTGYVCFFFLVSISALIYLLRPEQSQSVRRTKLILGSTVAGLLLVTVATFRDQASRLLDLAIFTKTQTESWEQRNQWNTDALQTAIQTYGFGAGWGVCRASSLLPTLLGNVGIPGTLLFWAFIARAFIPAWRSQRQVFLFKGQVIFGLGIMLLTLLVAGPEVNFAPMWLFFAAASAKFQRESRYSIDPTHPKVIQQTFAERLAV